MAEARRQGPRRAHDKAGALARHGCACDKGVLSGQRFSFATGLSSSQKNYPRDLGRHIIKVTPLKNLKAKII